MNGSTTSEAADYSNPQALLLALSLAGYPLVAILPVFLSVETQLITIPYRVVVLALSLLVTFMMARNGAKIFQSKFWSVFLLFWLLYSFRLFYELVLADNSLGFTSQEYVLFTYGITLIPGAAFCFKMTVGTLERARQYTFFFALAACCGNLAVGWETIFMSGFTRFYTDALNAVSFAALGAITTLISLTNIVADPQPTGRSIIFKNIVRSGYFLGIAIGLSAIYISGSRGPMLATFFCSLLLIWITARARGRGLAWLVPLAFLGVGVVTALGPDFFSESALVARFESMPTLEDRSDTDRLALWESGANEFLESPIFGSGLDVQAFMFYPHNLPLEAYMATGLVGGTCFLLALCISLWHAFRLLRLPAQYSWLGILYFALAMMSLFAGSVWGSGSLIHLMLAVMALTSPTHNSREGVSPRHSFRATSLRTR